MKLIISIVTSMLLTSYAQAAIPTVEGLFRNSSNKEVSSEGIVVSYSIEEQQQNEALLQKTESETGESDLEDEMLKEKTKPVYVRESFLISENRNNYQSIKYIYNSSEMKKANMIKYQYLPNYPAKIINEYDINKRVFYSLSAMYLLNDSKIIGTLLSEKGNGYKRNISVLDPDKIKLMERYKEYLIATREDPDLRNELASPLNPVDLEERGKVLDLMKKNMYKNTAQVNLIKSQNEFRWKARLGPIQAEFTNEGHRLKKFTLQGNGQIEVTTGDYILFDGIHELPKVIYFKGNNDRVYKIRFLSLKHYQSYKKSFAKKQKLLEKMEKEIRENGEVYSEHPLIL